MFPCHEIAPTAEFDWSLRENSWSLRASRNLVLKHKLKQGIEVQYQATDSSLWPHVCSGDICHFEPLRNRVHTLKIGAIVFCQIQDGSFHVQLITKLISTPAESAQASAEFRRRFVIGNFDNDDIGYAHVDQVYGRLFQVRSVNRGLVGNYGFC